MLLAMGVSMFYLTVILVSLYLGGCVGVFMEMSVSFDPYTGKEIHTTKVKIKDSITWPFWLWRDI